MRKVCILFIFCIFALCSCKNQYDAYESVQAEFHNSEIISVNRFKFLVIDSTAIYYVKCLNLSNGNITHKQLIKKWQSQYQKH